MIDFLKSFFSNEKSLEEKALLGKQRDVILLDAYAMNDEDEEESGDCRPSGCGSCGCH